MLIGINEFVRRQTPGSQFSYFSGTEEELVRLVEENILGKSVKGYRDGVLLVPVPAEGFYSGVVEITAGIQLVATYGARREGEDPYIQIVALYGEKLPAKAVDIVLYRRDVLLEDGQPSTEAEWEVVSINARATEEPEPLTPMAMARNMLRLPGGTAAEYTAEEFATSIVYWSRHAMRG